MKDRPTPAGGARGERAEPAFDPRRLDVARFAEAGATLEGAWPQSGFARLLQDALPLDDGAPSDGVAWRAVGEQRRPLAAVPETWLELDASTTVRLQCQRCLQPVAWPLDVRRRVRFVADEAEAERLDEESDDDVLAVDRWLDLHALVEDELILALPIVPRHEVCPEPLALPVVDEAPAATREHPFAALAAFKARRGGGGEAD